MITDEIRRIEDGERTFVDPRERKRTVPMEVLVLGMPRTGTLCMVSRVFFLASWFCRRRMPER